MALSGDASRLVVIGGTNTAVYNISSDLESISDDTVLDSLPLPQPNNPYTEIHDVSISMDGKTILISGCHSDFKTGYAHVFYRDTGAVFDLSSSQVPGYVSSYSYGTDCTLSGDGKTAAIFGSHFNNNTTAGTGGYIWKINEFTSNWEFVYKVDFAYTHRKVSCKLSHSGDTLFVCAPRTTTNGDSVRGAIFERNDSTTPPTWDNVQNINETEMDSGSMAGDGKTIAYVSTTNMYNAGNVVFNLWKRSSGSWSKSISSDNSHAKPYGDYVLSDSELSFDGSRIFAWIHRYDIANNIFPFLDIISDKTWPISNVLDYMNVKSTYFYFNYSFDYTTITPAIWNVSEALEVEIHDISEEGSGGSGFTNGYGHWDNTSISGDGRYVLVGAPAENKVYLYDTYQRNVDHTFTESGIAYFGLRCAMDDDAKKFVVVAHNNIYFYERRGYSEDWSRGNVNHGYGSSLFQLKMSKDASTVLLTEAVGSINIKKWDLGTDWTWAVSELSGTRQSNLTGQSGTERLSAIDLSYDGQYIVAGQHSLTNGNKQGDLTVFYPGDGKKSVVVHMNIAESTRYMHSVAISSKLNAAEEYTIITGEAIQNTQDMTTTTFHIIRFHKDGYFVSSGEYSATGSHSLSGLPEARYGRTAAMSYDGSLAVLSGTREDPERGVAEYNIGGAVIIDTATKGSLKEFDFEGTLRTGIVEDRYNGYGSSCRISSDNQHVLVGGGGYAFMYSAVDFKSLSFPFISNGTSEGSVFTFSEGGSYSSTNGLTLSAGESVQLGLDDNFQFSNTAGFMFYFDMKPTTINMETSFAIKISVDDSFRIRVANYNTSGIALTMYRTNEETYIDYGSGPMNGFTANTFKSFNVRFNYDSNIILQNLPAKSLPLLGASGFKPFTNQQVLTIYSEHGASIKNLKMYAFE